MIRTEKSASDSSCFDEHNDAVTAKNLDRRSSATDSPPGTRDTRRRYFEEEEEEEHFGSC